MVRCLHILRILCTRLDTSNPSDLHQALYSQQILVEVIIAARRMISSPVPQGELAVMMRLMQILLVRGLLPTVNAGYLQVSMCCFL